MLDTNSKQVLAGTTSGLNLYAVLELGLGTPPMSHTIDQVIRGYKVREIEIRKEIHLMIAGHLRHSYTGLCLLLLDQDLSDPVL